MSGKFRKLKKSPEPSLLLGVVASPDGVRGTTWARLRYHAQVVADTHNIHIRDLLGAKRDKRICNARVILYKHARDMGLSYPRIGKIFGRDHTTVMHAIGPKGVDIHKGA